MRCRLIISGRVQEVGFRYFARSEARALGLVGYARNRLDGRVEAEAEGPPAAVETFIARVRTAPTPARVEEVDVRWIPPQGGEAFRVE